MLPDVNLSHFEASLLFALFTSVLLGIITSTMTATGFDTPSIASCVSWARCSG
ncbi:MAG: hypothetical protein WDO18_00695 [Acidobacteriota bacterium]